MKKDKSIKLPPPPKIGIAPLNPNGAVDVKFTIPMLAPKKGTFLQPKVYNKVMNLGVESKGDGTVFKGGFGETKKARMLRASEIDGEAAKMGFVPEISNHNSTGFNV